MFVSFIILLLISESKGCPINCASCSDNAQTCDECYIGYWLRDDNYCSPCPSTCDACTNITHCTHCRSNFWDIRPNVDCGSPCSETCTASGCNDTIGHCYGCPPGFYGPLCHRDCDFCVDGQCDIRKCKFGCKEGYYEIKDNGFECKKCNSHCKSCKKLTLCTQCEKGFYLFSYLNSYNSFCSKCILPCEECISSSECICNSGKYGPTCSKDCNISNCKRCIEVSNVVTCTECINGYSLQNGDCSLDTNVCSQYCSNGCDSNENCLDDCRDGWSGMKCTVRCAKQCTKCDQDNENSCKICEGDFLTTTCSVPCSSHCIAISGFVTCDINNGTCVHGCDNGYWGDKCDKQCSDGCNSVSCKQLSGFCNKCKRTHYGESCQNRCSEHCADKGSLSPVCSKTNGKCVLGCEDGYRSDTCELSVIKTTTSKTACDNGYWGDKCDKRCYEGCNFESCDQLDGYCARCYRTHYGAACQNRCDESCLDNRNASALCSKEDGECLYGCRCGKGEKFNTNFVDPDQCGGYTKPFLLGILAGVGICLLFVVAFIAVRRIRRMRQKQKSSERVTEEREYENTTVTMQGVSSAEPAGSVYEGLDRDTRDDQHQYSGKIHAE